MTQHDAPPDVVEGLAEVTARYDGPDHEAERLLEQALARRAWRLRRSGKGCARCRETKPLAAFGADARERDGLHRVCRRCRRRSVS